MYIDIEIIAVNRLCKHDIVIVCVSVCVCALVCMYAYFTKLDVCVCWPTVRPLLVCGRTLQVRQLTRGSKGGIGTNIHTHTQRHPQPQTATHGLALVHQFRNQHLPA